MAAGRVASPSQLFIALLLVLSLCCLSCNAKQCEPSWCGKHNISHPFRLKHDPEKCGDSRYELSCEKNNLTVLYLYSGTYYVQAINYNNYTIRVVDANIHKGNCSSIPHYSLSSYNFSYEDPYQARQWRVNRRDQSYLELSKPIIFLTCETPVNSPLYVDTAPCNGAMRSSTSNGHSYVSVDERLLVSNLREFCRIELMFMISSQLTKNNSYIDIHNEIIYGFELTWVQLSCYIDSDTNKVNCSRVRSRRQLASRWAEADGEAWPVVLAPVLWLVVVGDESYGGLKNRLEGGQYFDSIFFVKAPIRSHFVSTDSFRRALRNGNDGPQASKIRPEYASSRSAMSTLTAE
ncbi:hypothetical protein L3X38_010490 [Prunus dulcis]|uniref:Wall-associated receptor kinase galacturonan-binding domain-containing protein n=1 Tax=Prunus dulcis TaxID=3755 RepID=A0AAD4WFQ3_PRUDU|nr:hypothetical protein L3X38_010490 [Prunus dulcis]